MRGSVHPEMGCEAASSALLKLVRMLEFAFSWKYFHDKKDAYKIGLEGSVLTN
jgi:hypothetical protein